jgi:hypothetical protein
MRRILCGCRSDYEDYVLRRWWDELIMARPGPACGSAGSLLILNVSYVLWKKYCTHKEINNIN